MTKVLKPTIISDIKGDRIIRVGGIDRSVSLAQRLENLKNLEFAIYGDTSILDTAPASTGEEVDLCFWKNISNTLASTLYEQYESKKKEVDVAALLALHEADPKLLKTFPWHAMQWKDKNGHFCYLIVSGGREVSVGRVGSEWGDFWSFAGV
jgi:hypothetical protein